MEKIKGKRWSSKEAEVLQKLILKYGARKGSKKASIELNRTEDACRGYIKYHNLEYKKIRHKCDKEELKKILKKNVSDNPNNLSAAFKKTAEKLNISEQQVKAKWYGVSGYKENFRETLGTCFMTIGKNYTVNSKNTNKNKKTGIWTKIKKLFKLK